MTSCYPEYFASYRRSNKKKTARAVHRHKYIECFVAKMPSGFRFDPRSMVEASEVM